jgi:phage-related protein
MAAQFPDQVCVSLTSPKKVLERELRSNFGDGYTQVAPDGLNSQMCEAVIKTRLLSGAQLTAFQSFLSTVGTTAPFTFTFPGDAVQRVWTIKSGSIKEIAVSTDAISYELTIEEDFRLNP